MVYKRDKLVQHLRENGVTPELKPYISNGDGYLQLAAQVGLSADTLLQWAVGKVAQLNGGHRTKYFEITESFIYEIDKPAHEAVVIPANGEGIGQSLMGILAGAGDHAKTNSRVVRTATAIMLCSKGYTAAQVPFLLTRDIAWQNDKGDWLMWDCQYFECILHEAHDNFHKTMNEYMYSRYLDQLGIHLGKDAAAVDIVGVAPASKGAIINALNGNRALKIESDAIWEDAKAVLATLRPGMLSTDYKLRHTVARSAYRIRNYYQKNMTQLMLSSDKELMQFILPTIPDGPEFGGGNYKNDWSYARVYFKYSTERLNQTGDRKLALKPIVPRLCRIGWSMLENSEKIRSKKDILNFMCVQDVLVMRDGVLMIQYGFKPGLTKVLDDLQKQK